LLVVGACDNGPIPLGVVPGGSDGSADVAVDSSTTPDGPVGPADDASLDAGPPRPWGTGKACPGCSTGLKPCGLRCVSLDDIRYGCADPSCGSPFTPFAASEIRCVGGKLSIRCIAGFTDCNGSVADGCEAQLDSPQTCGTCGNACAPGQVCDLGVCKGACSFPRTNCQLKIDDASNKGACRDLSSSTLSCGACVGYCGHYATSCTNGGCGPNTCRAGTHLCGEQYRCVDDDDPTFCGGCTARELREGEVRAPCAGGAPAVACAAGYEMCPQSCGVDLTGAPSCRADGCTSTQTDRFNCGACGNVCTADQRCMAGVCTDAPSSALASGLDGIVAIAMDTTSAYVSTATTITKIALADGTKTVLVADPKKPRGIAVDASHLYFASELGGAILRVPLTGGAPEVMFSATMPRHVIVDESSVTFCDQTGAHRGAKAPGAKPADLAGRGACDRLGQSNSSILVLAQGSVQLFDKSANTPAPGAGYADSFAVAEAGYYWVYRYRQQSALNFTSVGAPPALSGVSLPDSTTPTDLVSDGCAAYYAVGGAIWRYRPMVDTKDRLATANVRFLQVDATHIYWVSSDGSALHRTLK